MTIACSHARGLWILALLAKFLHTHNENAITLIIYRLVGVSKQALTIELNATRTDNVVNEIKL